MIKLLLKHEGETKELELTQPEISIGRSAENTIALNDKKASRKHAKIEQSGNEYRLVDLASGNGTRVNGKDVNTQLLGQGDEIQIGLSTLSVLSVPAAARPAAAPVAAPAAAAKPAEPAVEALRRHTRRGRYAPKRSSGTTLAFLAAALVVGAVGYVLYEKAQTVSVRPAVPQPSRMNEALGREAQAAYAVFKTKTEAEPASDALISEGAGLAERYGDVTPDFDALVARLKERRAEQIGKMSFAQVEGLVQSAIQERRFGDALDALKALKGTPDAAKAAILADTVTGEIRREFDAVDGAGKKLVADKHYSAAAEHYRTQAKAFRSTEHHKYLSTKPELLEELVQAELAAAAAKAARETELAKVPAPKPEMPAPRPEMPAPKPEMPAPKPIMPAPAPDMPKPAMPKPEMPAPKPAMPKPPEPKPDMPAPKPEPASASARYTKPAVLCDCKKIIKGTHCVTCERTLGEDDMRNGLCKKCEDKPKKIDLCVKRYFQAECHPEKVSDRPVVCDGKVYDFPHEDRARVVYLCNSCDQWGDVQSEIKHGAECKNRLATTKVCLKSGQGAHKPK